VELDLEQLAAFALGDAAQFAFDRRTQDERHDPPCAAGLLTSSPRSR
jgi:hypothetical protein